MAEKKKEFATEPEKAELVAKDFTDGMVLKVKSKEKFGLTFPTNYNYSNELMSAMLILQETQDRNKQPVLQSCSRASIENTLMDMVTQGLSMQKKQCYPIAYGGKLTLQKSVYGNTCIARRYGLKDIESEVIYKGDIFEYHIENAKKVIDKHSQTIESMGNEIIGAYSVATMKDGTQHTEIMTMPMIKRAWKQGYGYKEGGNGTHQNFEDQMCKKTVKNRLLKVINNTYGSVEESYEEELPPYEEQIEADVAHDISENENSVDFVIDEADVEIIEPDKVDNEAPFM